MKPENILLEIQKILSEKQIKIEGNVYNLHSSLEWEECLLLYNLILSNIEYCRTLEVGCAFGLSSMAICAALANRPDPKHYIIDPFQKQSWHGIGINNLKKASINFFELIEEKSEFALPKLAKSQEGLFDLVFIDGFHSLDHTLVDAFYSTRLLRVGGVLVIDDSSLPSVRDVTKILSRYPCYKKVAQVNSNFPKTIKGKIAYLISKIISPDLISPVVSYKTFEKASRFVYPSMVAFKKISSDDRPWNWCSHHRFC